MKNALDNIPSTQNFDLDSV